MADAKRPDPYDRWHPARLIPTAGIKGQEEQERRATSALLAVMQAVPEFGHALLRPLGAPRGRISSYAEVQFKDKQGKTHIPDGAVVVERGKTRWVALLEVKTGSGTLTEEQVSRYIDIAKAEGFDAVVTLSNAITAAVDDLPFTVDGRRLKAVPVRHLSWWRVITEAVVQRRYRKVEDPDQDWILGELIAYLDHEASGASGFEDMGPLWVRARDAAHAGTLRKTDEEAGAIVAGFEQLADYLALGLAQDLGADVAIVRPRKLTRDQRLVEAATALADAGVLSATLRIPDTVGQLVVCADLRARRVMTATTVRAPEEGRPLTKINWLLRQLKEAPRDLRIDVSFTGSRDTSSLLLGDALDNPDGLLSAADAKRSPKAFTLELGRKMGAKRGKGRGSFVGDTKAQVAEFYEEVLQGLRDWQPSAPRYRGQKEGSEGEAASSEPPSALTGSRPVGEATEPEA